MASREPGDVLSWARDKLDEILDQARAEGRRQASPYTFRPGQGPRGIPEEQALGAAKATGILGAGMLPGVGELMDIHEIKEGFQEGDLERAQLGLAGLVLPFVSGKSLRAYGDLRQSRRALQNPGEVAEHYPGAVRTGARAAGDVAREAEPRRVAAAAMKIDDPESPTGFRIVPGETHFEAARHAVNELGFNEVQVSDALMDHGARRGFVDRRGNFMQDREAINVGIRSGQLQNYKGPRNKIPAESFRRRAREEGRVWGRMAVAGDPNNPIPQDVPLPTAYTDDPLEMPRDRFNEYIEGLPEKDRGRLIVERTNRTVQRAAEEDPSEMMRIREGTEGAARAAEETVGPAAIRFRGKNYKGATHSLAADEIARDLGYDNFLDLPGGLQDEIYEAPEGFMILRGDAERFADRLETEDVGIRSGQIDPEGEYAQGYGVRHQDVRNPEGTEGVSGFRSQDAESAGRGADEIFASDIDERLMEAHFEGGAPGSTVNPRTGENMAGGDKWVVSTFKDREETLDELTEEAVAAYRAENADLLRDDKYYLGSWENDDGQPVLDVVRLYSREGDALRAGGRADQDGIFHLGRTEYRPLSAQERARYRKELVDTQSGRRQLEQEMLRGLDETETARYRNLNSRDQRSALEAYAGAPTPRRLASVALRGAPVRGWYDQSAASLVDAFGEDAPRFAAALAATSPQMPVDRNLDYTLNLWDRWVRAGKPTDRAAIEGIVETMDPQHISPGGIRNNVVRALSKSQDELLDERLLREGGNLAEPGREGILSGPKVDPFYANLVGETQRIVNDTHIARGFGTDPDRVGNLTQNLAQNALTRNAGQTIEQLTGQRVNPAGVQEMVWTPVRAMTEMSGGKGSYESAVDVLRANAPQPVEPDVPFQSPVESLTDLDRAIEETPSFATLMNDPNRRALLERIGANVPEPRGHVGMDPFDPKLVRSADVEDIAQRIDASRSGDFFYSMFPWLAGGGLASQLLPGETQQDRPQPPVGLLPF